jgi:predicted DNA-binding mobile mystery protein A
LKVLQLVARLITWLFVDSQVKTLLFYILPGYSLTFVPVWSGYNLTNMGKKSLQIQQLNSKMLAYASLQSVAPPPTGWIKGIRTAIGMSMQQLGNRLSITKQSALEIEQREKEGSITIKSLREAAKALDMQLVYGFVPVEGNLDELINRKAKELATQIVLRTSDTMKLEDQENTKQQIEKAIQERAIAIKNEMPKTLWD